MWQDEILDEIHKIREDHAKSFNYDLDAMFADWQKKQSEGGKKVVSLSPKRWIGLVKDIGDDAKDTNRL